MAEIVMDSVAMSVRTARETFLNIAEPGKTVMMVLILSTVSLLLQQNIALPTAMVSTKTATNVPMVMDSRLEVMVWARA